MKHLIRVACVLALATVTSHAAAQSYPTRPVKIVVPLAAGSATDVLARVIAEKLQATWGQPVLVENQPGANGIPGTEGVVKAAPDGYTLVMLAANHVINASLYSKLPFDTLKDVKPVVRVAFTALVLCVNPQASRHHRPSELIALAKAKPGSSTMAPRAPGSSLHLAAEMFKTATGTRRSRMSRTRP